MDEVMVVQRKYGSYMFLLLAVFLSKPPVFWKLRGVAKATDANSLSPGDTKPWRMVIYIGKNGVI